MLEDLNDFIRNGILYFLVLFILCGPTLADSNFAIQRMVQYEIAGQTYGSRTSALNMEAKALSTETKTRSCILTRIQDLGIDQFREITSKAGGLLVLLPKNLSSSEDKENILALEQVMLSEEVPIPVYFSQHNEAIEEIILEISRSSATSKGKESALVEIFNKISANGYQIVVSGTSHAPKKDSKIPVIQGELIPFKPKSDSSQHGKLPVIVITTQLKTFGITHISPSNYDTTIFLALIEQFSKLYNQMSSSAKYTIVFALHESGSLLNYQGAKKFLDTNLEESNLQNPEFVICLDSIADKLEDITMHVSKPLKEGPVQKFFEIIKQKAERFGGKTIDVVHKKINLADSFHKWSHERFSMRRVTAFTLSSLQTHTDPARTTIFSEHLNSSPILSHENQVEQLMLQNIETNFKILAESLASYVFFDGDQDETIFTDSLAITSKSIKPYLAPKSMSKSQNIKMTFDKFLKNVKFYSDKPDPRDPEFMFYEGEEAVLNIYNVKPAVFDLFLTFLIACYLFAVYFMIIHFPKLYDVICKVSAFSTPIAATNGVNNHKTKSN